MKTVLSKEIEVRCLATFAELAVLERRPELGLLCRAAAARGRRLDENAVESVVPGLSPAGQRNIIASCRALSLCDEHGGLTEVGAQVAERDEAPVPEQGVYELHIAEHPLLGRRTIAFERLGSRVEQRFELVSELPIPPDRWKVLQSLTDEDTRFIIRGFPSNHGRGSCAVRHKAASCVLRWTLDFHRDTESFRLEGHLDIAGRRTELCHAPERAGLDLSGLADRWGREHLGAIGRWCATQRLLEVAFDALTVEEQESFRKTVKLSRVEVPGRGEFSDVTLSDVPIGPASKADAQAWAIARLERRLAREPAYRTRAQLRSLFHDCVAGTPLAHHAPALPAHDALVAAARTREVLWTLAAPIDLSPAVYVPAELGSTRFEQVLGGTP